MKEQGRAQIVVVHPILRSVLVLFVSMEPRHEGLVEVLRVVALQDGRLVVLRIVARESTKARSVGCVALLVLATEPSLTVVQVVEYLDAVV